MSFKTWQNDQRHKAAMKQHPVKRTGVSQYKKPVEKADPSNVLLRFHRHHDGFYQEQSA